MTSKPGASPELPPPQQGISLHELTEAFAQAMGYREPAAELQPDAANGEAAAAEAEIAWEETPAPAALSVATEENGDACPVSPQSILEAMLFVGTGDQQPLTARQAAELMRGVEAGEIAELVAALNRRYEAGGCPYRIVSEGAGYRLTLRKAYEGFRRQFYGHVRETHLSQAAVDILAIVAYQQPVTAQQVSKLRGRYSNRALSQLVRRGLLRVERPDPQTRTPYYCTTPRFLEVFGLQSLDDLPHSEDLG